jgi:hypothetical protein
LSRNTCPETPTSKLRPISPAKELLPPENTSGSLPISGDGKLAAFDVTSQLTRHLEAIDLASGRVIFQGSMDVSDFNNGSYVRFSPDNRALVYSVLRNGGITLLYQPIDGSPPGDAGQRAPG